MQVFKFDIQEAASRERKKKELEADLSWGPGGLPEIIIYFGP